MDVQEGDSDGSDSDLDSEAASSHQSSDSLAELPANEPVDLGALLSEEEE